MHKDADELMRDRMDISAAMEGLIAGWLKRAGYWVVLTPEHSGELAQADMLIKMGNGKTLSHLEVKSRKLQFESPHTYPYPTAPLATKNSYKEWRDYIIISQNTHRAIVSPRDGVRKIRIQSDNSRGVSGPVWSADRTDLISFPDFLKELERRADVA